jgi:Fic family protein
VQTKEWIWQHHAYPKFEYDLNSLTPLMQTISRKQGELIALSKVISSESLQENYLQTLESEIISSAAIEGEILDRESVKSSIKEKLGFENTQHYRTKSKESHYVDILLDANSHTKEDLTVEKLFFWHTKMFEQQKSKLWHIEVGSFRKEGKMQIVSGVVGKEKVFYEAPPSKLLHQEMRAYLKWFNQTPASLLKASIAHLWFVIIHPFDDGNGRVTRAITEMVLSSIEASEVSKLYSFSKSIHEDRKGYYRALENTTGYVKKTNLMDITLWCEWFFSTLYKALEEAIASIEHIVDKTKFWDRHRQSAINERQTKVLNVILDKGVKNFKGALTTKKYRKITSATPATASRDIKSLLTLGCIRKVEGTAGRNIRYELIV